MDTSTINGPATAGGAVPVLPEPNEALSTDANPCHLHHLVVIGHPSPNSFNHSLAAAYCHAVRSCGQVPVVRDLYAIGFDPLLKAEERPGSHGFRLSADVQRELHYVRQASAITLVYPIWFGMPPAIITGYVDRVLGAGLSLQAIKTGAQHEALFNKQLVLLTTSGATKPWLAERGQWHGLREAFDFYLESIFSFADCQHEHFDAVVPDLHQQYADECLGRAGELATQVSSAILSAAHQRQKRAKLSLWGTARQSA